MSRSHLKALLVGVAATSLWIVSCADVFGIHGGVLDSDAATDAGGGDALPGKDAINVDVNTALCDGGVAVVADDQAIWVSHNAVAIDNGSCGAKTAPCRTIGTAIANAKTAGKQVIYLDAAVYDEVVNLDSANAGWTIQGGWTFDGATWTTQCQSNLATIRPADTAAEAYAVKAGGANGLTMRLLTISSKNSSSAATGDSVYALMVVDTAMSLDGVTLVAQNGANGAAGSIGTGSLQCSTFNSGTGAEGGIGNAGQPGACGASGFQPVAAGTGSRGQWGTATQGSGGACNTCTNCSSMMEGGLCPQSVGTGECGQDGGVGCAGQGGAGGTGGSGGGAAIALYLAGVAPSVTMTAGGFIVGSGGNGGAGGGGQSGGSGQQGSPGVDYPSCGQGTCVLAEGGFFCAPSGGYIDLEGGVGGQGGQGGTGGQGGGGAGGPIYYFAAPAATNVNLLTQSVTLGNSSFLGTPGQGGAPNGVAGEQAQSKVYP